MIKSRQAEVLARGSRVFLEERNVGPARKEALVDVVSQANRAVLRFPQTGQLRELALRRCVTALRCRLTGAAAGGVSRWSALYTTSQN